MALWSITATAGTIAMGVFAGRIVYRLSGVDPESSRWAITAAWIGALFSALGVLGMEGLPTLIANHMRMVLFTQDGDGWRVRPYNMRASIAARCSRTVSVTN